MAKRFTQKERLVRRLADGRNLTVQEAMNKFGIQSLSARIHELRLEGFPIYTSRVRTRGKRRSTALVTAYRLNVDATPRQLFNQFVAK